MEPVGFPETPVTTSVRCVTSYGVIRTVAEVVNDGQ